MRRLAAALTLAAFLPGAAQALSGTVLTEDGAPAAGTYLALMSPTFEFSADAQAGADGAFTITSSETEGYLVVQPPARSSSTGAEVFALQPRIFKYAGEDDIELRLPPVVNLVLEAYDPNGKLMLWEDFEKLGKYGGQFAYATNLDDEAMPMACWPVHGESLTGMASGPREKALPAILVAPGETACVSMLFWPTAGYGKLLLRADNLGVGFRLDRAGDAVRLNLNVELARTAVQNLGLRAGFFETGHHLVGELAGRLSQLPQDDPVAAAKAADALLADALRLRDELELETAKARIPAVRKGQLTVTLRNAAAGEAYKVSVKQTRRDFLFGVYEGSPYNAKAWELAREGGFDYATVLPAWNWTQNPRTKAGEIDGVFGLSAMEKLGYRIKAHGAVWMQGHGILPDFALEAPHEQLAADAIAHQQALIETIGDRITLWEAINEPANTNIPKVSSALMKQMMTQAAANIVAAGKPTLVNSPHEFSHGAKYWLYALDGQPAEPYPVTYSEYLKACERDGLLKDIHLIGLQCYPGFHLNDDWANAQGPAYTPSHLLDTLLRYKRFGKPIHITELSFPSSYGADWYSGYWREPWTPATQADYAEQVYTLAFAEPAVQSVTWWDIMDTKPSVITGGLLEADGTAKPVFERITSLMRAWNTPEAEAAFDAEGTATLELLGGEYEVTVTGPDGYLHSETFHLLEAWQGDIVVDVAG